MRGKNYIHKRFELQNHLETQEVKQQNKEVLNKVSQNRNKLSFHGLQRAQSPAESNSLKIVFCR